MNFGKPLRNLKKKEPPMNKDIQNTTKKTISTVIGIFLGLSICLIVTCGGCMVCGGMANMTEETAK